MLATRVDPQGVGRLEQMGIQITTMKKWMKARKEDNPAEMSGKETKARKKRTMNSRATTKRS